MTDPSHEFIRFFPVTIFFTTPTECMKSEKEGIASDDSSINENRNGDAAANLVRGDIDTGGNTFHDGQHLPPSHSQCFDKLNRGGVFSCCNEDLRSKIS